MNKEYDAVFIHGQGYSDRPGRDPVPSVRGRLQASAIRTLQRAGYSFDNFVFSGIPFRGQALSMSNLNADAVQTRTGVDESRLVIDQTARTTSMEVRFSRRQTEINNWKRVMHLTYGEIHQDQIRQLVDREFGKRGIEVDVFRADEVLTDPSYFDPNSNRDLRNLERYRAFIDCYNQSDTERQVLIYERRKYTFMGWRFDLGNRMLETISLFYRPDPSNKSDIRK